MPQAPDHECHTYHPHPPCLLLLQRSDEVGVASVNFKTKEFKVIKAGNLDRLIDSLFLEGGEIDGTYVR